MNLKVIHVCTVYSISARKIELAGAVQKKISRPAGGLFSKTVEPLMIDLLVDSLTFLSASEELFAQIHYE